MSAQSCMSTHSLRRLCLPPSKVRVGDWLRDLGRLRQVECVEAIDDPDVGTPTLYLLRSTADAGDAHPILGVRESIPLTLWREP